MFWHHHQKQPWRPLTSKPKLTTNTSLPTPILCKLPPFTPSYPSPNLCHHCGSLPFIALNISICLQCTNYPIGRYPPLSSTNMSSTPFTPPWVKFSPNRRGCCCNLGSNASSLSHFLINKSIRLQGMLTSHTPRVVTSKIQCSFLICDKGVQQSVQGVESRQSKQQAASNQSCKVVLPYPTRYLGYPLSTGNSTDERGSRATAVLQRQRSSRSYGLRNKI
jgi:hypothetical protein